MLLFLSKVYTEGERMEAFFNPQNYMVSDDFIDKNRDNILIYLCKIGVSYSSEISRSLSMNQETVNKILSVLKKEKLIDKIVPDRWHPEPVFAVRIPRLMDEGLIGYSKYSSLSWWMITPRGIQYLKDKYINEGVQIIKAAVDTLGLKVIGETKSES